MTSVLFEWAKCELGKFGNSKEGRFNTIGQRPIVPRLQDGWAEGPRAFARAKLQILVGLLCNREGIQVSIQVFEGNAAETGTLEDQFQKVRERFGLKRIVFIADRGILRAVRIKEDLPPLRLDWITALLFTDERNV